MLFTLPSGSGNCNMKEINGRRSNENGSTLLFYIQEFGMEQDVSEEDMMRRAIALSLGENVTEVCSCFL